MKFKPATLGSVHKQMSFVKAESYRELLLTISARKTALFFASDLAVLRLNRRA